LDSCAKIKVLGENLMLYVYAIAVNK